MSEAARPVENADEQFSLDVNLRVTAAQFVTSIQHDDVISYIDDADALFDWLREGIKPENKV